MRWLRTIWFVLTLRCDEADRLRSVRLSKPLSRSEWFAERAHRTLCSCCRRAARELELVNRGIEHIANTSLEESDEAWSEARRDRIERAVRSASNK